MDRTMNDTMKSEVVAPPNRGVKTFSVRMTDRNVDPAVALFASRLRKILHWPD
jgi:hypothetical protein